MSEGPQRLRQPTCLGVTTIETNAKAKAAAALASTASTRTTAQEGRRLTIRNHYKGNNHYMFHNHPPFQLQQKHQQSSSSPLLSSSSSSTYRWKHAVAQGTNKNKKNNNGMPSDRNRGVLGFGLPPGMGLNNDENDATTTTSTALRSTKSNVDSSAWNRARAWDLNEEDKIMNTEDYYDSQPSSSSVKDFHHHHYPSLRNRRHRHHQQSNRLLWSSNFLSPPYNVLDRVKEERKDLNIEDWQKELLLLQDEDDEMDEDEDEEEMDEDEEDNDGSAKNKKSKSPSSTTSTKTTTTTANSLAEWVRTVDLGPLLQRREEIHREKQNGKQRHSSTTDAQEEEEEVDSQKQRALSRKDLVQSLTKLLNHSSKSKYSNLQVKQMYAAAKLADQQGQPAVAEQILQQLIEATPQDARLYRRLARLYKEQGQLSRARAVLQQGLRQHPQNAYLWHGVGQLAATHDHAAAKSAYRRAIRYDPHFPNPYHALGTMEHSQGQIANAMQTLKQGIEYCPSNHRLHHALGDLYREAKMLEMAEKSYHKALKLGPDVSRGFAYTALAYVAYERGQVDAAQSWLRKATELVQGRNVNAWKSLASLEEAEGNTDKARRICQTALNRYEKGLLAFYSKKQQETKQEHDNGTENNSSSAAAYNAVSIKNALLQSVPVYRPGDRFFQLYRTWARLEERYGTLESAEAVYERATAAFPHNVQILLDWADLYTRLGVTDKARQVFAMACTESSAAAYRRFAEFEMSQGHYETARKIMFRGALRLTESCDGNIHGLAEMYHTWAVCEWHLSDLGRAEILLDHAIRLTPAGAQGAKLRSSFLYTLARLQYFRGEYLLAQHCIALCLKENIGSTVELWELWAKVAAAMKNRHLQQQCLEQASNARSTEASTSDMSIKMRSKRPGFQDMMRRDPWHYKIFPHPRVEDSLACNVQLPSLENAEWIP